MRRPPSLLPLLSLSSSFERARSALVLLCLLSVTPSSAEETKATASAASPSKTKAPPAEVAKDPENKRGISPLWEKIVQGDTAALSHDYPTAMTYYQAALASDPKNPIAHLRLAEVALKQNKLELVPDFLESATRFAGSNLHARAQAAFLTAQMHEQLDAVDDAIAAWAKYKALAVEVNAAAEKKPSAAVPAPARVFLTTADRHTEALQKRKELLVAYAGVRERIEKNVAAADQATGASASPSK